MFELTIRAVGGLLSAHMLIEQVGAAVAVAGCACAMLRKCLVDFAQAGVAC